RTTSTTNWTEPVAGTGLDRAANLLGALALVVADRTGDAIGGAAGQSTTAATALSALYHFLDRPSVDRLRQVLGLTSSGTVRLVDRLVEAGHVRRESGTDGRSTVVVLTAAGRRAARKVAAARAEVLGAALAAGQRANAVQVLDRRSMLIADAVAAETGRYVDAIRTFAAAAGAFEPLTAAKFVQTALPLEQMRLAGATSVSFLVAATDDQVAATQAVWRSRGTPNLVLNPVGNG